MTRVLLSGLVHNGADLRGTNETKLSVNANEFLDLVTSNQLTAVRAALALDASLAHAHAWAIGTTALHAAAHRGLRDMVELLLSNGADVHAREAASDTTPLHWAAEGGHLDVARTLVRHGALLHPEDSWYHLSPLGWAAVVQWEPAYHKDKPATAAFLVEAGAPMDIFSAVVQDRPDDIRRVVIRDLSALRRKLGVAAGGMQPLHLASSRGLSQIVEFLLQLGADLNARTTLGVTPLGLAMSKHDERTVRILREHGAPFDLSAVVLSGDIPTITEVLRESTADAQQLAGLLFVAIRAGAEEILELLLRSGADPNTRFPQLLREVPSQTAPLHLAAARGATGCASLLLAAGADANAVTDDSTPSPLHLAAGEGHKATVSLLLKHNADRHIRDRYFDATPAQWAEFGGHTDLALLLQT